MNKAKEQQPVPGYDEALTVLCLFEKMADLKKGNKHLYSYLEKLFLPAYASDEVVKPSRETLIRKITVDLQAQKEVDDELHRKEVEKRKKEIRKTSPL